MSAQLVQIKNKLKTDYRRIIEVKEEIEMRLAKEATEIKARLTQEFSAHCRVKLISGLALGVLLMTATALPLGHIKADGPSIALVNEDIAIGQEIENVPGDAWMYDSPFYEVFAEVGSVEVQSPAGDAWMFDAPFYEVFPEAGNEDVEGPAGDAWMYDSPFYESFE